MPVIIKEMAANKMIVIEPKTTSNKISKPNITINTAPSLGNQEVWITRKTLNKVTPRNINHKPTIIRIMATLVATWVINTIPKITSIIPNAKCQLRRLLPSELHLPRAYLDAS